MDHIPSPKELRTAGRACTFLAYAAGLAGVAAGTLVLRDGELAFAIILWTITFAVGAALMGVSLLIRAFSGIASQLTRMESDLRVLADDHARQAGHAPPTDRDPWLRH
jgi:choline-glycine betaine transporter